MEVYNGLSGNTAQKTSHEFYNAKVGVRNTAEPGRFNVPTVCMPGQGD